MKEGSQFPVMTEKSICHGPIGERGRENNLNKVQLEG